MTRTLILALALVCNACAFAQTAPVATTATPASPRPHAVDMTSCRDGTKVMIAVRDRFCASHGGVGPPAATVAPKGATAKCGDGSYSLSQDHQAACSNHGGVAAWL
jgi:hypothetical protein